MLGTGSRLIDQIAALDISPAKKNGLRGFVLAEAMSVDSGLSRNTVDEYRRIIRGSGLVVAAWTESSRAVRLDYDRGLLMDVA